MLEREKYYNHIWALDVRDRIGVPFEGELNIRAKSQYRTDYRPYHEVLSSGQKDLIRNKFRKEFDLHGYDLD